MSQVVGISQKIKRVWLDAVLDRLVMTTDAAELRAFLDQHLKAELPGPESRAKNSGILLRIWSGIPANRIALRNRAMALLPRISGQERIWLHWGMTALAYPFFRDIAEIVGRLLALQDDFTTAQVQGRMLTTWGDRATSKEAAQKLITTLVDWEVLRSTKTKGHFLLARKMTASIPDLQLWLLEALLAASAADEIEAQQLLRLPEAFPFSLSVSVADLRRHEGFNIHRQGLDMDMVALRPVPPPPKPAPQASAKAQLRRMAKPQPADLFAQGSAEYPVAEPQPVVVPVPTAPAPSAVVTPAPVYPFAVPSAECARLFEMGYYYAGIALTQAVIEAQVLYLGQVRLKRKPNLNGRFEKGLEALYKKRVISDEQHTRLAALLAEWRTLGYLQIAEADEPGKLAAIARQGLALLHELERGLLRMG